MAELTHDDVKKILEIVDGMQDCEVSLELGELKLHVSRQPGGASPVPAAHPSTVPLKNPPSAPVVSTQPSALFTVPAGQSAVRAPTMGTFYRASSPGAKPYVEVGDHVQPDDTVGVFEVMKLFSSLRAGVAGTVAAIPVANATLVAQDQPLVLIALAT